jgi:hypothetical protein
MPIPGFTAEASLGKSKRTYHGIYLFGGAILDPSGLSASMLPSTAEVMEESDDGESIELVDELESDVDEMEGAGPLDNGEEENGDEL